MTNCWAPACAARCLGSFSFKAATKKPAAWLSAPPRALKPTGDAELPHLSVYGSLLVAAATSAARDQRSQEAHALIRAAAEVGDRVGVERHDYESYFGPGQVAMQQTDVHIVTENYTAALDAAKRMPKQTGLPLASQARHLADQALSHR